MLHFLVELKWLISVQRYKKILSNVKKEKGNAKNPPFGSIRVFTLLSLLHDLNNTFLNMEAVIIVPKIKQLHIYFFIYL